MRQSRRKGLAIRPDLESCTVGHEAAGEALTGVHLEEALIEGKDKQEDLESHVTRIAEKQ